MTGEGEEKRREGGEELPYVDVDYSYESCYRLGTTPPLGNPKQNIANKCKQYR